MKSYTKKQKKNYILSKTILGILIIFMIATVSIVLYDMYINIEIEDESYTPKKVSQEINAENTEDTSTMLENIAKSVVRNIKNRKQ